MRASQTEQGTLVYDFLLFILCSYINTSCTVNLDKTIYSFVSVFHRFLTGCRSLTPTTLCPRNLEILPDCGRSIPSPLSARER